MSIASVSFSSKVELVTESLLALIRIFQTNPANYFYEEEIRSELFNILRKNFNNLSINLLKDNWFKNYAEYIINPVKAEYGKGSDYFSKYNISDIDIAILSNNGLLDREPNNFLRYCDVVIELKYSTDNFDSRNAGFKSDIDKVRFANNKDNKDFLGMAICFDLNNVPENEDNFLSNYNDISLFATELNSIKLISGYCYALYITPKKIFISLPLERKQ